MPSEEHTGTPRASDFSAESGKTLVGAADQAHSGRGDVVVEREQRCETCRHWDRSAQTATVGLCRANPPTWRMDASRSEWPRTDAHDWCGGFGEPGR